MAFAKVYSAQPAFTPSIIDVEVDLSRGLHAFSIVGLATKAVEESQDRIAAAIKNSGFESPKQKNQKVVVSLAPATVKKEGAVFDVATAIGYLLASNEISFDPKGKMFLGELTLNGNIRPISGTLPIVEAAKNEGFTEIFVPPENAEEAALVRGIKVMAPRTLKELLGHLSTGRKSSNQVIPKVSLSPEPETPITAGERPHYTDLSEIRGQYQVKRAMEIAAAGKHNMAMFGPPGTGKTLLARAFTTILPELSLDDAFEVTSIHSLAGTLSDQPLLLHPPFRGPHHSSSYTSFTGGGVNPKPGEMTLAHKGVLFMDEFPEYERRIIEALRQPMEERTIQISRAKETVVFPAHFTLIAAMNPCPCGYFTSERRECTCTAHEINRYQKKISGPIADRIDIWSEVNAVKPEELTLERKRDEGQQSEEIRKRVEKARKIQYDRFGEEQIATNSEMSPKNLERYARMNTKAETVLNHAAERMGLSARSYHRVIKIARTIADLEEKEEIEEPHILEATQYRPGSIFNAL